MEEEFQTAEHVEEWLAEDRLVPAVVSSAVAPSLFDEGYIYPSSLLNIEQEDLGLLNMTRPHRNILFNKLQQPQQPHIMWRSNRCSPRSLAGGNDMKESFLSKNKRTVGRDDARRQTSDISLSPDKNEALLHEAATSRKRAIQVDHAKATDKKRACFRSASCKANRQGEKVTMARNELAEEGSFDEEATRTDYSSSDDGDGEDPSWSGDSDDEDLSWSGDSDDEDLSWQGDSDDEDCIRENETPDTTDIKELACRPKTRTRKLEEPQVQQKSDHRRKQERKNANLGVSPSRKCLKWETSFELLVGYKDEHGHTRVPRGYMHASTGYHLGSWVHTQRRYYSEKRRGLYSSLTDNRIQKLNRIGFEWKIGQRAESWNSWYELLAKYQKEHGHTRVPERYVDAGSGWNLGQWAATQRAQFSRIRRGLASSLTEGRIRCLNSIYFEWKHSPQDDAKVLQSLDYDIHRVKKVDGIVVRSGEPAAVLPGVMPRRCSVPGAVGVVAESEVPIVQSEVFLPRITMVESVPPSRNVLRMGLSDDDTDDTRDRCDGAVVWI